VRSSGLGVNRYLRPIGLIGLFGLNLSVGTRSCNLEQDWSAWRRFAERELGALLAAVTELFGADQARQAAEDWLSELESLETLPNNGDWRPITIAAATRLAQRLNCYSDTDMKSSPLPSRKDPGTQAGPHSMDTNQWPYR
jgi:hypothetical protein